MIQFKSFLAAVAALAAYLLLCLLAIEIAMPGLVKAPANLPPNAGYVSNSQSVFFSIWPVLIGAVLIFAEAYSRTFGRLVARRAVGE